MSWLFKSLQIRDPDPTAAGAGQSPSPEISPENSGGMKEDFSVLGQTIGRQIRGVATFLAPPPQSPSSAPSDCAEESRPSDSSPSPAIAGIRNDLVEIGGSFKSGLSRFSSNKAVAEISKFASNLLQFQNVEEDKRECDSGGDDPFDAVPGITEEVVNFVEEISIRPECWTDFPLSLGNDFKMSDAQREHASAIEHLIPDLAALRSNLHSCMEDVHFWMIYFILLLPRLSGHDFELLTTPKVVETRDLLLQKLQKRRDAQGESSKNSTKPQEARKRQAEKVTEITDAMEALRIHRRENTDQSSEETDTDKATSKHASKNLEDDDDISFSDLEDDDNDLSVKLSSRRTIRAPSPSGSSDWVQLNRSPETQHRKLGESSSQGKDSEGEESSGWLAIGDSD